MYENEKNLYNYTYRKSGRQVEDAVYYTTPAEPVAQPVEEVAPPVKRKKRSAFGMVCLALCCALLGGGVGAGAMLWMWPQEQAQTVVSSSDASAVTATTDIAVSDRSEVTQTSVAVGSIMTDSQVYAANVNTVVSINTTATTNYFGQTVEAASSGSGFIITTDGYIVTNYHVIEDSNTVSITLYSNEQYDATVIGADEDYDLAVLKIDATGLQAVTLGDSDVLSVGDRVLAIGNPLGELTFSMSGGMVSSVNRAINVSGVPFNMIQTDAAVNPGNSGGPLFNSYGEVIGIVSAKYSTSSSGDSVEGLGFAIPMNDVKVMIEDIITNGYVTNKPYLGVTAGTVSEQMAAQNNLAVGLYIYTLEAGGAADRAGLQVGDVVTKVEDATITSLEDFSSAKRGYVAGDTVSIEFYRGQELRTTSLTWDAVPQQEETQSQTSTEVEIPQTPSDSGGSYYYYGNYNPFDMFGGNYGR